MRLIASVFLFALVPALGALWLYRRGRCSGWWVLISPIIGLFVFCVLVLFLVFMSGDM